MAKFFDNKFETIQFLITISLFWSSLTNLCRKDCSRIVDLREFIYLKSEIGMDVFGVVGQA